VAVVLPPEAEQLAEVRTAVPCGQPSALARCDARRSQSGAALANRASHAYGLAVCGRNASGRGAGARTGLGRADIGVSDRSNAIVEAAPPVRQEEEQQRRVQAADVLLVDLLDCDHLREQMMYLPRTRAVPYTIRCVLQEFLRQHHAGQRAAGRAACAGACASA
jgi:hypothetical protein